MSLDWENAGKLNADFFDAGCDRHGSVGWRAAHFMDRDSQIGVYHALTSKIPLVNSSILDVGCGQGDLFSFLRQQGKAQDYLGIDVSSKMVAHAKKKHGDLFAECNFLDPECSFEADVVIGAGPFNVRVSDDDAVQFEYLCEALRKMYDSCKKACVVTLLSSHGYEVARDWKELACYEPWDVMRFCMSMTSAVYVDHASIPAEFVVACFRD